jgi:ribosome maturation factor RimP
MGPAERVRDLILPLLDASDLELVDVEVRAGLLRIAVDRPGGVDMDAIGHVSQSISAALDREDPLPGGRYVLEVSSPGLERPLRTPEHFRRFVGATVAVKLLAGAEAASDQRRVQGRLAGADEDGVVLEVPGQDAPLRVDYADIEAARTVFEWGPPPRPGRPGQSGGGPRAKKSKKVATS